MNPSRRHLRPELLSSLIDGELAAPQRASAEAHLAGCERCRAELEALRLVTTMVRAAPLRPLPQGRDLRVPADAQGPAVVSKPARRVAADRYWWQPRLRFASAMIGIALFAAVGTLVLRGQLTVEPDQVADATNDLPHAMTADVGGDDPGRAETATGQARETPADQAAPATPSAVPSSPITTNGRRTSRWIIIGLLAAGVAATVVLVATRYVRRFR